MRCIKILLIIFLSGFIYLGYSQKSEPGSKIDNINDHKNDTVKVNMLIELCDNLFRTNPVETRLYGNNALELATSLKYLKGQGYALKYIGMGYFVQGQYVKAMDFFQRALEVFEKTGDKKGVANMLSNKGVIYNNEGNDAKALDLYLKSLEISDEINDSLRVVTALSNIGLIYSKKETTLDKAKDYYNKALLISEKLNYSDAIGTVTVNMGELYYAKGEYKEALLYFEKSLKAFQNSSTGNIPYTLINIGKIYLKWNDFENAIKYQEEALTLANKSNSKLESGQALIGLGNTYLLKGDIQKALKYFLNAEKTSNEIGAIYEQKETYEGISRTYAKMSDYLNAYRYNLKESSLKDTLYSERNQLLLNQLQIQYEIESMLKENEILKRDAILREAKGRLQFTIIIFLFLGFVSISTFLILLFRANNQKKRANSILTEKNMLITSQKQAITDSILYAVRIQNAILPPFEQINSILPGNFIFFQPRDIVSGDFYWTTKSHGRTICVAADCTGHGVPGALMSMLGVAFLNEIVSRHPGIKAGDILNELRKNIVRSLHQTQDTGQSKDGMDIALLVFDENMQKVEFAGANNPLIHIKNGEVTEYKGDRMPVGIHTNYNQPFSTHTLEVTRGDMLYIFSDGYCDQFGGPEGKKFRLKNLKDLLLEIHEDDIHFQGEYVKTRFNEWKNDQDQVDDILVMGIRV